MRSRPLRDLRLLLVSLVTWLAVLGVLLAPGTALIVTIALWSAALGLVGAAIVWLRLRSLCGLLALASLAAGLAVTHVLLVLPAREDAQDLLARQTAVTGTIVSKVEPNARGALRWNMALESVETEGGAHEARATVRVEAEERSTTGVLDLGSVVRLTNVTVWREEGARETVALLKTNTEPEVLSEPPGIFAVTSDMRSRFTSRAEAFEGHGGQLLPGLAVGDTRLVDSELDAAMKATSLAHLLAVSGANCSLIVAVVFGAASLLGAPRALRVVLAGAALAGFVVLVTPEASVVRAATMAALALASLAAGRRGIGISVLGLAVTGLLVSDPWLASSLGFALSAVATGALLLFAAPLANGLARIMPRSLALLLSVPLAAQLACGPLLVLVDPTVPLWGVFANVLAAPAAAPATILGVLACLTEPVPLVSDTLFWLAWLPSSWVAATGTGLAALPAPSIAWFEGIGGALSLAVLGALAVLAIVPLRRRWPRLAARTIVAILLGVALGGVMTSELLRSLNVPQGWGVAMCDVGQGDAFVIRSRDVTMLLDTGPDEQALRRCLGRLGVDRVDALVITHFDHDHVGAAPALRGRVTTVYYGLEDVRGEGILDALRSGGATIRAVSRGDVLPLGAASARVLWPRKGQRDAGNDASVVLDIAGPDVPSGLFLGDTSEASQQGMLRAGAHTGPRDLVKVAHHGSADQAPALYRRVTAAVALISVGEGNRYGHPRSEALQLVAGTRVLRSDRDGTVLLGRDREGLWVWREHVGRDR